MELRVKEICKEKGISITGLADMMNISKATLSQAINGNPTIGTLEKIAGALGVPFIELFEAKPTADTPPPVESHDVGIVEYVQQFTEQKKQAGMSVDKYKALGNHLKSYNSDVLLHQVNKDFINGFVEYLEQKKIKSENYIQSLTAVLNSQNVIRHGNVKAQA